ncbi:hypothetical protein QEN19_004297 [Hanseniaspora menglaensis]
MSSFASKFAKLKKSSDENNIKGDNPNNNSNNDTKKTILQATLPTIVNKTHNTYTEKNVRADAESKEYKPGSNLGNSFISKKPDNMRSAYTEQRHQTSYFPNSNTNNGLASQYDNRNSSSVSNSRYNQKANNNYKNTRGYASDVQNSNFNYNISAKNNQNNNFSNNSKYHKRAPDVYIPAAYQNKIVTRNDNAFANEKNTRFNNLTTSVIPNSQGFATKFSQTKDQPLNRDIEKGVNWFAEPSPALPKFNSSELAKQEHYINVSTGEFTNIQHWIKYDKSLKFPVPIGGYVIENEKQVPISKSLVGYDPRINLPFYKNHNRYGSRYKSFIKIKKLSTRDFHYDEFTNLSFNKPNSKALLYPSAESIISGVADLEVAKNMITKFFETIIKTRANKLYLEKFINCDKTFKLQKFKKNTKNDFYDSEMIKPVQIKHIEVLSSMDALVPLNCFVIEFENLYKKDYNSANLFIQELISRKESINIESVEFKIKISNKDVEDKMCNWVIQKQKEKLNLLDPSNYEILDKKKNGGILNEVKNLTTNLSSSKAELTLKINKEISKYIDDYISNDDIFLNNFEVPKELQEKCNNKPVLYLPTEFLTKFEVPSFDIKYSLQREYQLNNIFVHKLGCFIPFSNSKRLNFILNNGLKVTSKFSSIPSKTLKFVYIPARNYTVSAIVTQKSNDFITNITPDTKSIKVPEHILTESLHLSKEEFLSFGTKQIVNDLVESIIQQLRNRVVIPEIHRNLKPENYSSSIVQNSKIHNSSLKTGDRNDIAIKKILELEKSKNKTFWDLLNNKTKKANLFEKKDKTRKDKRKKLLELNMNDEISPAKLKKPKIEDKTLIAKEQKTEEDLELSDLHSSELESTLNQSFNLLLKLFEDYKFTDDLPVAVIKTIINDAETFANFLSFIKSEHSEITIPFNSYDEFLNNYSELERKAHVIEVKEKLLKKLNYNQAIDPKVYPTNVSECTRSIGFRKIPSDIKKTYLPHKRKNGALKTLHIHNGDLLVYDDEETLSGQFINKTYSSEKDISSNDGTPQPYSSASGQNSNNAESIDSSEIHKNSNRSNRLKNRRYQSEINKTAHDNLDTNQNSVNSLLSLNQLSKRRKPVMFARSAIHNWGLYALEPIMAKEMIIEYVGEVLRQPVSEKRERQYLKKGIGSSYLFRIDEDTVIDATKIGGIARFINHCCEPSCTAKIIKVGKSKRIVIYALRDIMANEELTYDYKFERETDESERIKCLCGAPSCKGFLN